MAECCANGCSNRFTQSVDGITFHRFPENPDLRDAWITAVQKKDWIPSRSTRICSVHFSEDQIDRTSYCKIRLKENAVPNIFNIGIVREKKECKKVTPKKKIFPGLKGVKEVKIFPPGLKEVKEVDTRIEKIKNTYCRIAKRPSTTEPHVISIKPASTTTTANTTSVQTNLVTSSPTTITTALPINLFPQILSASAAPIITSAVPSIIATNIGNFLTTGIPQTITLPLGPTLAAPSSAPIIPSSVICSNETMDTCKSTSASLNRVKSSYSLQEQKIMKKLVHKNMQYVKIIRILQNKVSQQRQLIDRLSCTIKILKAEKRDNFLTECLISEEPKHEVEQVNMEELGSKNVDVNVEAEFRSDYPRDDELIFEEVEEEFLGKETDFYPEFVEKNLKVEFRTRSPDEILP